MKIAVFSDMFYPELAGISDSILMNGVSLGKQGNVIDFFVPKYSKKNYHTANLPEHEINLGENVNIHRTASVSFPGPSTQGRAVIPTNFLNFFNKHRFDIVHSHGLFGAGIDALFLSKMKKIPIIGTNHTYIEAYARYSPIGGRWIEKALIKYVVWYYNKCDFVTTPSQFLLEDMRQKGFKGKGAVVSNPIEKPFFTSRDQKEVLKKELGFSPFTILYAGRFSAEKNLQVLIDAFMIIIKDIPEASLVLAGHGPLRSYFENQVIEKNMSEKIKIVGPFLGKNKSKFYDIFHAADVFVMPSTSETQSMGILQAMASGIPVIGANAGALPEMIGKNNGYLFSPDNADELVSLLHFLYDINNRSVTCNNASHFAHSLSEEAMADKWENIYTTIQASYKNKYSHE